MRGIKILITILFLIPLSGCSQTTTMTKELAQLDQLLKEKRPAYYVQLQAPLSLTEMAALETKYKVQLPADVKALYTWKNGQEYTNNQAFANNSMFESLETVLRNNQELTQMIGYDFLFENWWHPQWLPLFSNGGGSYICYDMGGTFTGNTGQLLEFWQGDNDRNIIAPDLTTFIQHLNSYYQETDAAQFDEFFDISERLAPFTTQFIADKPIPKKY